jgi:hypothetical protein
MPFLLKAKVSLAPYLAENMAAFVELRDCIFARA